MAKKYILVNDTGTTGNKAVIFDEDLNVVASDTREVTTYYPHLNWASQKISEVYDTIVQATRATIEKSKIDPKDIAVVSFSNQMMTMIPIDKEGNVLMDEVGIWCDMRQDKQSDRLMNALGGNDEYYKITGVGWQPELAPICKLMWYKDNVPEIYNGAYTFLQYKELFAYRMTGKIATEYGDMSMNGMMDCAKKELSQEIFKAADIDASKLPDIINSHDIIGRVTKEAAEVFGLAEGTPVTLGSGDVICANTGAGIIREGVAYTYIGSANWSAMYTETPSLDPKYKMNCNTMQPSGGYGLVMITAAGGIAQDWVRDGLYDAEKAMGDFFNTSIYDKMTEDAKRVAAGSDGLVFLPYLRGGGAPHFDIDARGAYIGLGITHTKAHLLRALYEGICFNMRWLYDLYRELGYDIFALDEIRAIGGGVLNDLWMQIYANVNNMRFTRLISPQQSTALGAGIIGGVGAGVWKDYEEATAKITADKSFDPEAASIDAYNDLYQVYRESYLNNAQLFTKLGQYTAKYVK